MDNKNLEIKRVNLLGIAVDSLLAISKITVGKIGGSAALVADGVHSFSDLISDFVVYYAHKYSIEVADDEHPYGHERFETAATLILGFLLVLVSVGLMLDVVESENQVQSGYFLLLVVAGSSVFLKELLFRITIKVGIKHNSSMLKANAWHHRSDSASSLVVIVGIVGGLLGIPWLDTVATVVVSLMIGKMGAQFFSESIKQLVDTSISVRELDGIRGLIRGVSGVEEILHLRGRYLGDQIDCNATVVVGGFLSVSEGHRIAEKIQRGVIGGGFGVANIEIHIDPENQIHCAVCDEIDSTIIMQELSNTLIGELAYVFGNIERVRCHYYGGRCCVDVIVRKIYLNGSGYIILDGKYFRGLLSKYGESIGDIKVFYI